MCILLGDVVESSEMDTEAGFAILLRYDDDGAWPCTVARFYYFQLQHLVYLISYDLSFEWTRAIRLCPDRDGIRWGHYGMLSGVYSTEGTVLHCGMRA